MLLLRFFSRKGFCVTEPEEQMGWYLPVDVYRRLTPRYLLNARAFAAIGIPPAGAVLLPWGKSVFGHTPLCKFTPETPVD